MIILVQYVLKAAVTVENKIISAIDSGYVIFIGIESQDTTAQADFLAKKVANLRIFTDADDKRHEVKGTYEKMVLLGALADNLELRQDENGFYLFEDQWLP